MVRIRRLADTAGKPRRFTRFLERVATCSVVVLQYAW